MLRTPFIALPLILTLCSTTASAAEDNPIQGVPEFAFGMGYAHVSIGDSDSELHGMNALKVEPIFSFAPIQRVPQLRLGVATGISLVLDETERAFIFNNGATTIISSSEMPFFLFQPEVRLSWRHTFGDSGQFFIEPGVVAGAAIGWLDLDDDEDTAVDESYSESDATWQAGVFLQIGARVTGGTFGVEASYRRGGDMDFAGNASGEVSEFYVGVFGALQF